MPKFDGAAFGNEIIEAVKAYTAPLFIQINELKAALEEATKPIDYTALLSDSINKAVVDAMGRVELRMHASLPSVDAIKGMIDDAVTTAVAKIEVIHGKDGANGVDGKDGTPGIDGKDGVNGQDGKSVTIAELEPIINDHVNKFTTESIKTLDTVIKTITDQQHEHLAMVAAAVEAIPVPVDGKSVTLADVQPILDEALDKAAETFSEQLVAFAGDIETLKSEVKTTVSSAIESIRIPTDGVDGKDGRDGVDGKDGTSVTFEDVQPLIDSTIETLNASIELAKSLVETHLTQAEEKIDSKLEVVNSDFAVATDTMKQLVESFVNQGKAVLGESENRVNDALEILTNHVADAITKIPAPINGKDGTSVTVEDVLPVIRDMIEPVKFEMSELNATVQAELDAIAKGADATINDAVERAKATMVNGFSILDDGTLLVEYGDHHQQNLGRVRGHNGENVNFEEVKSTIFEEVSKQFDERANDLRGEQGPSVDMEVVKAFVDELVDAAVKTIPIPVDGKDGMPGVDGKDGIGLAGALIDRDGELQVTLTNGEIKKLGPVVGKDGSTGAPGLDGVSFDDMDIVFDEDERTLTFVAEKGENKKRWDFKMSHVLDKGVYREGVMYLKGDGTTFGGSFWIAQNDTDTKPGTSDDWRLAVKKGRDGRDRPQPPHEPVTNLPLKG